MTKNRVVKNFVIDVDGVMTDGKFHYSSDGKVMKVFGPDDSDALKILSEHMNIHFVTGDKRGFSISKKRIVDDMNFSLDLVSTFERSGWIKKRYNPQETIYMGDGIFDPLVFNDVGFSIAPANASTNVAQAASFITSRKGSEGAVAEACLYILKHFFSAFDVTTHEFSDGVGIWKASRQIKDVEMRKNSILTGKPNLEHLYTLKKFPVFMGCVETDINTDLYADMIWDICRDTGIIQLRNVVPLELVYPKQHFDSTGRIWKNHRFSFTRFIEEFSPTKVLEIGGANGLLAKHYVERNKTIKWSIVEPNPTFEGDEEITVINEWFDDSFKYSGEVDTIIHSHVLEHVYDPVSFLKHIYSFLKPGKKLIFSLPNLEYFLRNRFTNGLNFEHTLFISEKIVDYLLEKTGFKIIKKYYYLNHSIFYATKKVTPNPSAVLSNQYEEYKRMFNDFIKYHTNLVREINKQIESYKGKVYLFGAHIFSQYLLAFGLKTDKIVGILDNSPDKQNRRLYGTNLKVFSPQVLKNIKNPGVILKAGHYNDEIKDDILNNINSEVTFW